MDFSCTRSFVNSALKGGSASSDHHKEEQGDGVCVCVRMLEGQYIIMT